MGLNQPALFTPFFTVSCTYFGLNQIESAQVVDGIADWQH